MNSHHDATQKQMSYLESLATKAGFVGHMQVNKALTGNCMYFGARNYPSKVEASRMIDALLKGVIKPSGKVEVEESWVDLDTWDNLISDLVYQANKGYDDDVEDTLTELEEIARRLPSKSDEWTALAIKYDYVV